MARRWQEWTTAQDDLLRELGSRGVDECRLELWRRFGVHRSNDAIAKRASRIGVSLASHEVCPGCGRTTYRLRQTGLCDLCHERSFLTPSEQRAQVMREAFLDEEDMRAIEDARRARARERKRRSRGEKLVKKMSNRRSDA